MGFLRVPRGFLPYAQEGTKTAKKVILNRAKYVMRVSVILVKRI
jgi:hypothetical protein